MALVYNSFGSTSNFRNMIPQISTQNSRNILENFASLCRVAAALYGERVRRARKVMCMVRFVREVD